MAVWLPFKANANERNRPSRNIAYRQRFCKICGKVAISGDYCQTCKAFLQRKRKEERQNKDESGRIETGNS